MSTILDDVRSFILSQGFGAPESIFMENMQEKPDNAICVYEYSGNAGIAQIDAAIRSVQIVVRDETVVNGRTRIHNVFKSLRPEDGIVELTPQRTVVIDLRQTPFKLKVDSLNRTYYAFNMGITTNID